MPIKRRKNESVDSREIRGATTTPETLTGRQGTFDKPTTQTELPQNQSVYSGDTAIEGGEKIPETTGRTWSDLLVRFVRKPQFVPTILTAMGFLLNPYIFKDKVQTIPDLKYPLAISFSLNAVYYGVGFIVWVATRCRRWLN